MTRQRYSLLTGLLLCLLMTLIFVASRPASAENIPLSNSVASDFVHQTSLDQPGEISYLTEASSDQPLAIVSSLLQERHQELGLTLADTATTAYVVSDLYKSDHNGVTHVYLQQTHQGIRVHNSYVNSNVTSDGRVLNLTSAFIPGLSQVVNGTEPSLTAAQAVNAAADYLGFLSAGGSRYPLEALRSAGVDLTQPAPVEAAFEVLGGLIDKLDELVNSQNE